jgi:hypothetical protein
VGFLLLCAVIAVIMIATRLNARSRSRSGHPAPRLLAGPPQAKVPAQPVRAPQAPQPPRTAPVEVEAVPTGEPPSPLEMLSPKIAQVPPELAARVVALMNKRQDVSAVRLLCDELRIGILDAQKTARSLVGR